MGDDGLWWKSGRRLFRRTVTTLAGCGVILAGPAFGAASLTVTATPEDVIEGEDFTLTIEATNDGSGTESNLEAWVFFLIDAAEDTSATLVAPLPDGWTENRDNPQEALVCDLPPLAAGESISRTLTVRTSTASSYFLLPTVVLYDRIGGGFATNDTRFLQIDVVRDFITDSDGDGVADRTESLLGFDPDNAWITPGVPTLDVLVTYAAGAAALYTDNDPTTRINHLFAVANTIAEDSDAGVRYAIAGIQAVTDNDTDSINAALSRMDNASGGFTGIDTARDAVGADLVIHMRPFIEGSGICGLAFVLGVGRAGDIGFGSDGESALGVVNIDCRDRTHAHEIGHILGLGHDRTDADSLGTFNHSRGYGLPDAGDDEGFVTVMGLASNHGLFSNDELNVYSNPSLDCRGRACGVDRSSVSTAADAAGSLRTTAYAASTFRFVDGDSDGVPDHLDAFPADGDERFDTDDDGVGNAADPDDDGDGISDTRELQLGFNALDPSDGLGDPDGDGYDTAEEIVQGSDPNDANSVPLYSSTITRILPALFGS